MNRCTLLIDGGWLNMSRFYVLKDNFSISQPTSVKEQAAQTAAELMARSINLTINRLKVIDNIILIKDKGTWRKSYERPKSMGTETYKGNRKTSRDMQDVDWPYVYKSLDILTQNMNQLGITCSECYECEGDDWIWHWSRKMLQRGTNCIIWSSDNDLKQLVSYYNNALVMWYNEQNGLFLPKQLDIQSDSIESFMKPTIYIKIVEELRKQVRKISYVDPNDIIIGKIICGDAGDNILPCATFKNGKRTCKITLKNWADINEQLGIKVIGDLLDNIERITKAICEYPRFKNKVRTEIVEEMIRYNIHMVWLHNKIIPQKLQESMSECEYKEFDLELIKNNFKLLCDNQQHKEEMENLFEEIDF